MKIFILLVTLCSMLNAESKLALLMGNSKYEHIDVLSSPSQDIPALAKKLRGMGFNVMEVYDLDEKAMKKVVKDFKRKLQKNPNAIALFYYSGHGAQAYGESYLIPIDGDTRDEADVDADAIKVETIAQKMASANTKANILFLDACRDVPTGTMGGTKGLGQVKHRPSGSLIVYSTSKGTTAKDDRLFNTVVLQKLALSIPLSNLANQISYTVNQKTNGSQTPEVFVKSLPEVCLGGKCAENSTNNSEELARLKVENERLRRQSYTSAVKKPVDNKPKPVIEEPIEPKQHSTVVHKSIKLRYGGTYYFTAIVNAAEEWVFVNTYKDSEFIEKEDYNNGKIIFGMTTSLINNKYKIRPYTSKKTYASTAYHINKIPSKRLKDNIIVKYKREYQLWRNGKWTERLEDIDIQPYEITWCGDGIIDNYTDPYGNLIVEECDPGDKRRRNMRTYSCTEDCRISR